MYSGFLGSPDQVSIIQRLYREYPSALRLVDPVMGDAGQMYPTYTPELCEAMGALADGADVLMPNLTEASILTKRDYPGQDLDDAAVTELLDALLGLGAKNVVLKGIDHGDGKIINYVASAEKGAAEKVELVHDKLPYMIHGTGDASRPHCAVRCWPAAAWPNRLGSRANSYVMRWKAPAISRISRSVGSVSSSISVSSLRW